MQSLGKIREELKAIRYYYARKKVFNFGGKITGAHEVERLAIRYNDAMRSASPWLYDLYIGLYVRNNTQESLSLEMNYSQDYIQRENKKLMQYLQSNL